MGGGSVQEASVEERLREGEELSYGSKESVRAGFLQKQSLGRVGNKEERVGSLLGGVRSFYIQELWIL